MNRRTGLLISVLVMCVWNAVCLAAGPQLGDPSFRPSAEHPYGFRGDGLGVFAGVTQPPTNWNGRTGEGLLWRTPIPARHATHGMFHDMGTMSSPIIVGDTVFTQAEPHRLYALDKNTGVIRWMHEHPPSLAGKTWADNPIPMGNHSGRSYGYSGATPVSDGTHIWAVYAHGVVVCRRLDGRLVWANTFDTRQSEINIWDGIYQSPILCGNILVVGGYRKMLVMGFDARTGKHLWSLPNERRRSGKLSFPTASRGGSTRVVIDGKDYAVVSEGWLVDPQSGEIVQHLAAFKGDVRASFATTIASGGIAYHYDASGKRLIAVPLTPGKDSDPLWEAEMGMPHASAALHEDLLYVIPGRRGSVEAFDARTGKQVWKGAGKGGGWTSLALAGGYVYDINGGSARIYRSGRVMQQPIEFKTGFSEGTRDGTLACCPVFEGTRMYHRDRFHLYCIDGNLQPGEGLAAFIGKKPGALLPNLAEDRPVLERHSAAQGLQAWLADSARHPRPPSSIGQTALSLVAWLADADAGVSDPIRAGLEALCTGRHGERLGPEIETALMKLAESPEDHVQASAFRLLGVLKSETATATLKAAMLDKDTPPGAAQAAIDMLVGRLSATDIPEPVPEHLLKRFEHYFLDPDAFDRGSRWIDAGKTVALLGEAALPIIEKNLRADSDSIRMRKAGLVALDPLWKSAADRMRGAAEQMIAEYRGFPGHQVKFADVVDAVQDPNLKVFIEATWKSRAGKGAKSK